MIPYICIFHMSKIKKKSSFFIIICDWICMFSWNCSIFIVASRCLFLYIWENIITHYGNAVSPCYVCKHLIYYTIAVNTLNKIHNTSDKYHWLISTHLKFWRNLRDVTNQLLLSYKLSNSWYARVYTVSQNIKGKKREKEKSRFIENTCDPSLESRRHQHCDAIIKKPKKHSSLNGARRYLRYENGK